MSQITTTAQGTFLALNRESVQATVYNTLQRRGEKAGMKTAVRLNGGSDLDWTNIYNEFTGIQFWDYTKRPDLAIKLVNCKNVHVTYSYSETTTDRIFSAMVNRGINIATVFDVKRGQPLPTVFRGAPVVDGDQSDLRFRDRQGLIVGLRFKAAKDRDSKRLADVAAGFIQRAG